MNALEKNWNYLNSWMSSSSELHGVVTTYWDQAESITDPHVMNHFPVIEGLVILYQKFKQEQYKKEIARYSEFLISSFNKNTKLFENAWGDLPGKDTGVVHQSAAAGALLDAYTVVQDPSYLKVALKTLHQCKKYWPKPYLNGVLNQTLKYSQAVCKLKEVDNNEFAKFEKDLYTYLDITSKFVYKNTSEGILLDQSIYNGMQMTVYESKSLHGLLALHDAGVNPIMCKNMINSLIKGIFSSLYVGNGRFISHIDYRKNLTNKIITRSFAVSRRIVSENYSIRLEILRRSLMEMFVPLDKTHGPYWLSRIADSLYIIRKCSKLVHIPIEGYVEEVDLLLKSNAVSHGGYPNSINKWVECKDSWPMSICSTRWNAYVFRYLCDQVNYAPTLDNKKIPYAKWNEGEWLYEEDNSKLIAKNTVNGKSIEWIKPS